MLISELMEHPNSVWVNAGLDHAIPMALRISRIGEFRANSRNGGVNLRCWLGLLSPRSDRHTLETE